MIKLDPANTPVFEAVLASIVQDAQPAKDATSMAEASTLSAYAQNAETLQGIIKSSPELQMHVMRAQMLCASAALQSPDELLNCIRAMCNSFLIFGIEVGHQLALPTPSSDDLEKLFGDTKGIQ